MKLGYEAACAQSAVGQLLWRGGSCAQKVTGPSHSVGLSRRGGTSTQTVCFILFFSAKETICILFCSSVLVRFVVSFF